MPLKKPTSRDATCVTVGGARSPDGASATFRPPLPALRAHSALAVVVTEWSTAPTHASS